MIYKRNSGLAPTYNSNINQDVVSQRCSYSFLSLADSGLFVCLKHLSTLKTNLAGVPKKIAS